MLSKGSSYFTLIFVTAQLVMGALARAVWSRKESQTSKDCTQVYDDTQKMAYGWCSRRATTLEAGENAEWNAMVKMKDTTAAFDAGIEALHECCLVVFETMAAYQRVASSPNDGKIEREKGATLLDSVDCKLSRVGKRREG